MIRRKKTTLAMPVLVCLVPVFMNFHNPQTFRLARQVSTSPIPMFEEKTADLFHTIFLAGIFVLDTWYISKVVFNAPTNIVLGKDAKNCNKKKQPHPS